MPDERYTIVPDGRSITCRTCGLTSYNPNDVAQRYCGRCNVFHHDLVNHPSHYSHPSGIECIEVARHMNFNLGNALKYIWRAGAKGDAVTDLRKARWYIDDEIARLERNQGENKNASVPGVPSVST